MSWRSIVARQQQQQQQQREKRKDRQKVLRARAFIALPTNTNTALVRCRRAASTFTPAVISCVIVSRPSARARVYTSALQRTKQQQRQSATALAATIGYTQTQQQQQQQQQQRSCAPNGNEKARDNGKNLRSAVTYPIKRTRERALEELFCICSRQLPVPELSHRASRSQALRCDARAMDRCYTRHWSRYI
uniref:Uncharacterized protein n=1 Tax=Trichogramma kaykai TaxID=54128 RepID=A0ABD2WIS9_9HYME